MRKSRYSRDRFTRASQLEYPESRYLLATLLGDTPDELNWTLAEVQTFEDDKPVAPLVALVNFNSLIRIGNRTGPDVPTTAELPPPLVDVDVDDAVCSIKAIQAIRFLRRRPARVEGGSTQLESNSRFESQWAADPLVSVDSRFDEAILDQTGNQKHRIGPWLDPPT